MTRVTTKQTREALEQAIKDHAHWSSDDEDLEDVRTTITAHERAIQAKALREAAEALLASLVENGLLSRLVSINGAAQAMRDYAVGSLRTRADRIESEARS